MTDHWLDVDELIESQLKLQVEIAYDWHHQFLVQNGLDQVGRVLDLGTGNGFFLNALAKDHPEIKFVGADKRPHLLARGSAAAKNISWLTLDAQSLDTSSDVLKTCGGVLMRYFLLHVPNAREILSQLKAHVAPGAHFWIIDVDLSDFECTPRHPSFEKLKNLVHRFCTENSIDTFAGRNIGKVLSELGFLQIEKQAQPFASNNTRRDQLVQFLKQEAQLYSHLLRRSGAKDLGEAEILKFIEEDVGSGAVQLSYGMIHWHAISSGCEKVGRGNGQSVTPQNH